VSRRRSAKPRVAREIEVRIAKLDDGTDEFDEVVAENCTVHLEKMSDHMFTLMVYTRHETACFQIYSKNWKSHVDGREWWHESERPKRRRVKVAK
jgi:hypothetical protein